MTTNRVLAYQASGRNSGGPAVVVDEIGSGLGCATMDWRHRNMAVARDEAIYLCGIDGRGACYAYEGKFPAAPCMYVYLINPNHRSQILDPHTPQLPCHHFTALLPVRDVCVCDGAQSRCPPAQRDGDGCDESHRVRCGEQARRVLWHVQARRQRGLLAMGYGICAVHRRKGTSSRLFVTPESNLMQCSSYACKKNRRRPSSTCSIANRCTSSP